VAPELGSGEQAAAQDLVAFHFGRVGIDAITKGSIGQKRRLPSDQQKSAGVSRATKPGRAWKRLVTARNNPDVVMLVSIKTPADTSRYNTAYSGPAKAAEESAWPVHLVSELLR